MKNSVFEYKDYRAYLNVRLATTGASRGMRRKLSQRLLTQPAFISRVLAGEVDFSMEHVPPINELLEHTEEEAHYFTLLVSLARAGSAALEKYYRNQLKVVLDKRNDFIDRVKATEAVPAADQALYYSQWYFLAIHVLVNIPQFQTRESIAERLQLPLNLVSKTLDELCGMGLVEKKGVKFIAGKKRIHLAKNSPWISHFHTHFRLRAVEQIALPNEEDLHFSMGMSISKALFQEYRRRMLDLITEFEGKMVDVKDEELYAISVDLFRYR